MADEESALPIRCRVCRYVLFAKGAVVDSHGSDVFNQEERENLTCTKEAPAVWYIPEERMPSWMKSDLDKGDWLKGKLHCPSCEARLGSYNFVNAGLKCTCNAYVLPPVHIVKSKVDAIIPITIINNTNT